MRQLLLRSEQLVSVLRACFHADQGSWQGDNIVCSAAMQGFPGALNVEGCAPADVSRVSPAETTEETRLLQGWKVSPGLALRSGTALGIPCASVYTISLLQYIDEAWLR